MFIHSHFELEKSFLEIAINEDKQSLPDLFAQYDYIVIKADREWYCMEKEEAILLEIGKEQHTIEEWLNTLRIPSSSIATFETIHRCIKWERPVLIMDEAKQKVMCVLSASERVHYLQQANNQLSAFFKTLAETINDAVTAVDKEGNVVYWNGVAETTYNIRKEAIIGKKIGEHFDADSIFLHHILKEGNPVRGIYHRPNENTHVLMNASPIIDNNRIIGGVATEHDITKMVYLNKELDSNLPLRVQKDAPFSSIVTENEEVNKAVEIAQKMTHADIPVLITGERGTGKELLAQAIHYGGSKNNQPFISLNCSVIPTDVLEMELFGYQKVSFQSGKEEEMAGKLEQAKNGSLFIEDIEKMSLAVQQKLMDYMAKGRFTRVGGKREITSKTRVITSSSQSLMKLAKKEKFNEKLYFQLSVIQIEIPPLRNRKEDIPHLIHQFIKEYGEKHQKKKVEIGEMALNKLMKYDWPGNVKELRNVVERCILLTEDNKEVSIENLPAEIIEIASYFSDNNKKEEIERIEEALHKTYGNKSAAANLLGISRGTLYNKIKEYGL
ncbi:sigma-54 interaction domain-containing protein [Niallia sp. 03133]|uniref:sigma-54 interaction domain-containing protein n=1 Tax=Niallia sp. 03133 TaxID=3458060 RepID=UPI004044D594